MFYVYLLQSKEKFYVGYSTDLKRRLEQHNAGQNIATKAYLPWTLVFYEAYADCEDAKRREGYLKTGPGRQALRRMLKCYSQKKGRYVDY